MSIVYCCVVIVNRIVRAFQISVCSELSPQSCNRCFVQHTSVHLCNGSIYTVAISQSPDQSLGDGRSVLKKRLCETLKYDA